jgi:hypothetical protein
MSATDNRPQNLSFLSQVGFKFEIARSPNFNYFIQKVRFPGVSLPELFEANPFVKSPVPGDHLEYEKLEITFKLDEDMRGYFDMYDWLTALGKPEDFSQSARIYQKPLYDEAPVFSQGTLIILNGNMMPNIQVIFYDMLPVRLSGFELQTDATDVQYITASMTLSYRMYKYDYVT